MHESERIFAYIDKVRKQKGISKNEFVEMIGCSRRIINYWEKGERKITIDMADKALKALGVSYTLGTNNTAN